MYYHELAVRGATRDSRYALLQLPPGKEGFIRTLEVVYRLFGALPANAIIVAALMAALFVPVVYDTTWRLWGDRPARVAVWLVVLWPSLLLSLIHI